ncbi:MAG: hypothetical protein M1839_008822 [Geoglossum umbratile]|nr:MAG: hypothetical protein M1839_008822 [Geoglossum umbratile]
MTTVEDGQLSVKMQHLSLQERENYTLFRRQYLQLLNPDSLAFPASDSLRNESFQIFLYEGIFKPGALAFPPQDRYQLRVLKELVLRVEKSIVDPEEDGASDELFSRLSILLAVPLLSEAASAQQKSYVTYTLPLGLESLRQQAEPYLSQGEAALTLLESRSLISASGTTGLRTWEAALHLGGYLSLSPEGQDFIGGKRVIELGAGTGFLSILCAKYLGARRVLATDGDPGVVEALEANFFLNGLDNNPDRVRASVLKWGWALMGGMLEDQEESHRWDVALGADVTYDSAVIPHLVSTLRGLFDMYPKIEVLISATIRDLETFETFILNCRTNKFVMEDIAFQPIPFAKQQGLFYPTSTPIRILHINRPGVAEDPWAV